MIYKTLIFTLLFLTIVSLTCCKQGKDRGAPTTTVPEAKRKMEHINRVLVDKDKEKIEAYISRRNLDEMQKNKSGLFYMIWGEPNGPQVKTGSIVFLNFQVSLLDGTVCYSSQDSKPLEFLVGQGGVESGLEMAVLLMQQGQKGKFILPPHLGHGLLGDLHKIPPLAILVYDVEVIEVIEY